MYCQKDTDKCNPCAGKRPRPEKPDGSYDTAGAITAIAEGGMSAFRSKFIDNGFITMSGWGYVGAGVMDGVLGVMEAGEPDSAAWNLGGEPETSSWQFRTATLWPTKNPH
eukprot:g396.t1